MFTIISTCKGGGYMYARTSPPHPKRNSKNLYPLHRVLMENKLGRLLNRGEEIHHKDEDKSNNCIENLVLITKSEHAKLHAKKISPKICICSSCYKNFELTPCIYRARVKRSKSGNIYCCRKCMIKLKTITPGTH